MSEPRSQIQEILDRLARERDELKLKIHLGKAEARDEWEKLEKKLAELKAKAAPYTEVASDTAKNVGSALELAAEEIRKGYRRIRERL